MSDLRPLYRAMAARGENFQGLSILKHKEQIHSLILQHEAHSLLDFGCGRGDAYFDPHNTHVAWGVPRPWLYDPAFPQHDHLPLEGHHFDGVLCSDVLEHVEKEDLDVFIGTLFGYASKFVWASVCCRPAKKTFLDGRNLHVTVKPLTWWQKRFKAIGKIDWVLTETP